MLLPFLPSLMPREAWSQTLKPPKRFIYIGTEHGGASFANMYGTQGSVGSQSVQLWPGNTANYAPLALSTSGTTASLSPICTAPSTVLTPAIVQKMNIIRGIDHANTVGHQDGAHLGNNQSQIGDRAPTLTPMVTIDQVMAYSPNFYTDVPRTRTINIGGARALSWTYTNPTMRTGVQALQRYSTSVSLFNSIFATASKTPSRPLIIDHVLDNYKSLRQSNRRLSAADKTRLDDHVARLTGLQQQIAALNRPLSCGMPATPADNTQTWAHIENTGMPLDQQGGYYKSMADILLTAFACDASRISVFHALMPYTTYVGDWHQDIAHQFGTSGPQVILAAAYQETFEHLFMYLAQGLDGLKDADGSTMLDNTLLVWGQECGFSTHDPWAMPLITAGKAGGYFKTGLYVDYRNQVDSSQVYVTGKAVPGNFNGLMYPQFLATVLYSMGITQTEWKQPAGQPGYGDYKTDAKSQDYFFANNGKPYRPDGVFKNASMPLPIITGT
jgi:hypothetical protein